MITPTSNPAASANALPHLRLRLGAMMFLQYAVYGLWLPIAARFLSANPAEGGLGFNDTQIGRIIAVAGALGAIFAPFIAGQIADRHFATERFLAVLMIAGGALKFITGFMTTYPAWLWLSISYAVLFMPTLALSNSLAMTHLADPKREFPAIRVWGTVSWIVVAWAFPMIWLQTNLHFQWLPPFFTGEALPRTPARMIDSVKVAGILSMLFGLYCWLVLPATPPKRDAAQKLAFARAFALVRYRSFAVFLLAALLISSVHFIYFMQTSKFLAKIGLADRYLMPAMSVGQFAEIAVMAVLGRMLARLGFRVVIPLGAFCYALRYAIFGTVQLPVEVMVISQALHGFCFACFFAGGFIYVDRIAPPDVRASAQTVIMMVLFGVGQLIGGWLNGFLSRRCTVDGVLNYQSFWYTLAAIALVASLALLAMFRDESQPGGPAGAQQR